MFETSFGRTARKPLLGAAAALVAGAGLLAGPAAADTVKIGSILSVTGPAAFLGEDMKGGMEIAIEEINANGGVGGKQIEWFFYDAESQSTKGVNSTKRLLTQDNVDIVVGGGNMSGIALAMVPLTERSETPFISTEGSMQIVNPVAERQWSFKSTADDDQVLERIADYFEKKGIKKVALLYDTSGFGQSAFNQMETVGPKRGLEVVYETFSPTDTDMTAQLTRIKESGAEAIICWTVTPAGVVFIKQAQQLGLGDLTLIHSYGFVSQRYMELAGDAAKDLLLVSVKFPVGEDLPDSDPVKARIADLTAKFEKKFGRAPNQFAAQTYDAIHLAAMALEKGRQDKAKVRDALQQITGWQGVGGVFNFSPERHSGLSKDDMVLVKWEDGRFRLADYK